MNNILCMHHNDLDGYSSGAIVKKYFDILKDLNNFFDNSNFKLDFFKCSYGVKSPWDLIKKYDTIIMVDFTLQPFSEMIKLNNEVDLIWIDHHKGSIDELNKTSEKFEGIQKSNTGAGCQLTWKYFFKNKKEPKLIKAIGSYDEWNKSDEDYFENIAKPVFFSLNSFEKNGPEEEKWEEFLDDDFLDEKFNKIKDNGIVILDYLKTINKQSCNINSFVKIINGIKWLIFNTPYDGSTQFDSVFDEKKHDLMCRYNWDNKKFKFGIYTTKTNLDLSKIAKNYGGGGHKKAAGFALTELPW